MGSFGNTFQFGKGKSRTEQDLASTEHVGTLVFVFHYKRKWHSEIHLYTGVYQCRTQQLPHQFDYVFESLLVILLTLGSRIVGLLSGLVVLPMIPLTSKNQHRGFKF